MKVCGIITEYNPFHNGHRYHIAKAKEMLSYDILVNVMSGNFVQRGEPAIIDKWIRAKTAVEEGCDIVIELPYAFAVQSADGFAHGAIQSLTLMRVTDLVFGSECNDLKLLQQAAASPLIHLPGQSLASTQTVNSNDILGIAYMKALKGTTIQPHTIQRTNQYHDTDIEQQIASATAIRKALQRCQTITHTTPMADMLNTTHILEAYYPYIQYLLLTLPIPLLQTLFLMDEGIEHLMRAKAKQCDHLDDFVNSCISKRYTRSNIQRTLIHLLTHTSKSDINNLPPLSHVRVLAINRKGQHYLHALKTYNIHVASRFQQIPKAYREMDLKAASAYNLVLPLEQRIQALKKEVQPLQRVMV